MDTNNKKAAYADFVYLRVNYKRLLRWETFFIIGSLVLVCVVNSDLFTLFLDPWNLSGCDV